MNKIHRNNTTEKIVTFPVIKNHSGTIRQRQPLSSTMSETSRSYESKQDENCRKRLICQIICQVTAAKYDINLEKLLAPQRGRVPISRARQIAMYLANTSASISQQDVAECFGRDRKTVSHACEVIEDLREKPEFDAQLTRLETLLQQTLQEINRFYRNLKSVSD